MLEKKVIQMNDGITKNVNVNVKIVMYLKKILFGMLLYVVTKTENMRNFKCQCVCKKTSCI